MRNLDRANELLIEFLLEPAAMNASLRAACGRLWKEIRTREPDRSVAIWGLGPASHRQELLGALERLQAHDQRVLEDLLVVAVTVGAIPEDVWQRQAASGRNPAREASGSVSSTVQGDNMGVFAGRDVQMRDFRQGAPSQLGGSGPDDRSRPAERCEEPPEVVTEVLFLGASPSNRTRMRLEEEVRLVERALRVSEFGGAIRFSQQWAVRLEDLQDCLHRYRPRVVHFSGHGEVDGLVVEGSTGAATSISAVQLRKLFSAFSDDVRCVILNCCHSAVQSEAVAEVIECTIGVVGRVPDEAAMHFSVGFYRALAAAKSVGRAFQHGCLEVDLFAEGEGERLRLNCLRSEPGNLVLVRPPAQGIGKYR